MGLGLGVPIPGRGGEGGGWRRAERPPSPSSRSPRRPPVRCHPAGSLRGWLRPRALAVRWREAVSQRHGRDVW